MYLFCVLISLLAVIYCTDIHENAKPKALFYATNFAYSHIQFSCSIAKWVKEAGFEVHVLFVTDVTEPDAEYCPGIVTKQITQTFDIRSSTPQMFKGGYGKSNMISSNAITELMKIAQKRNTAVFGNKKLFEIIKSENYDVGFVETFSIEPAAFFKAAGIRTAVGISAIDLNGFHSSILGLPNIPSCTTELNEIVPVRRHPTLWNRIKNIYIQYLVYSQYQSVQETVMRHIWQDLGNSSITKTDIENYYSLHLINSPLLLHGPRPTTHTVLHIGGSLVPLAEPLTGKLAKVMSNIRNKAIYVSFGTLVEGERFPQNFVTSLLESFKALPQYDFIVKGSKSKYPELPNVHVFEWIDQPSLLAHKNLSLFYTHGGQNSVNEAVVYGVPLLVTPIFGDQHHNAELIQERGIGVQLPLLTVTAESMIEGITTVLEDPTYAQTIKTLSEKLKALPNDPKETFIKWLRYLYKFGDLKELQLPSVGMDIWEYYSLDVFLGAFVVVLLSIIVLVIGLKWLILPVIKLQKQKQL